MQHSFQLVILQVIYHTAIIYSRNNICTHDTLFYSCLFLACLLVCCASQLIIEHTELTHNKKKIYDILKYLMAISCNINNRVDI